jgi:hypothetical protein
MRKRIKRTFNVPALVGRPGVSASWIPMIGVPQKLAFMILIGAVFCARAQTPGTFSATGSMTTARVFHTATLLQDGRVLIVGGVSQENGPPLASAELYNPTTGAFTATGDMIAAREEPAATLLTNGKVLISGGGGPPDAEIYDPSTGTFSAVGAANAPGATAFSPQISGFDSTLLMNGNVLTAGGNDDPGESILASIYDPSTKTSMPTGNLTVARADISPTLLPDGTVLIAGSNGDAGLTLASAELYDPITGTFTRTGDMTVDRGLLTATLLNNGKVLIAGGIHYVSYHWPPLASAELYTPASVIPAPVLFSLSGDSQGQGAIWNSYTGQIASDGNRVSVGDVLSMYTTSLFEGGAIPPQVAVGGRPAEILFFGGAPGYPGYYQVNFRVPDGVVPGPAVPVRLNFIGRTSSAVTIGVQ